MNYRLRMVLTSLALTTFTATTAALATAQEAALIVGTAIGLPGHRVSIDVYLYTGGFEVAGTQNDIGFSPEAAIAADENGQPLCTVNPAIRKNATAFSFPPPGCPFSGTPCTTVRALVLAFDNSTPIPDGSPLHTCQVDIAPDATPGVYAFDCSNSGSGNPEGNGLPTTCLDGSLTVVEDSVLTVGTATGLPGDRVSIAVALDTGVIELAGIENQLF